MNTQLLVGVTRHLAGASAAVALSCGLAAAQAPPAKPDTPRTGVQAAPDPGVNPQAAAVADFQKRLQGYVDLRAELSKKLRPLSPTADSAELTARQDTLAAAIREARKGAKPGDMVPTRVAGQIRNTVASDFRRRSPETKRAVLEEVPDNTAPAVNKTMPDNAALATVPPLLLNNLPRLPDNLQYRFLGRHVLLIDGDTRLIIDYILNALPQH
jgi:hypothetical protein